MLDRIIKLNSGSTTVYEVLVGDRVGHFSSSW
jgi:hypothetical protein